MGKLKEIFSIICILTLALLIEFVRVEYKIPATVLDIILFPVMIIMSFIILRALLSKKPIKFEGDRISFKKLFINFILVTLIALPLSCWGILSGLSAPLEFFSGVKGSVHGYTLVTIGVFLLTVWLAFFWEIYIRLTCKDA